MGRRAPLFRLTAMGAAVTMLLTGCVFGLGTQPGTDSVDHRIYLGDFPAPLSLPALPAIPPQPVQPADTTDSAAMDAYYLAQADYNNAVMEMQDEFAIHGAAIAEAAVTAAQGGRDAVAAWQSLMVTAGVSVTDASGSLVEVGGNSGFGWPMSDAQLRLHAVLGASSGGLGLADLADALQGIPELADADLVTMLYDELLNYQDYGFGAVFAQLAPGTFMTGPTVKAPEEVVLSWAQVSLVLHRLAAELAIMDSVDGQDTVSSQSGSAYDAAPSVVTASFTGDAASSKRACDVGIENPWAAELLNQFNKAHATVVFDKVVAYVDEGLGTNAGGKIGIARVISAFATMLAKAAALRADFSVSDTPLVRTKNTQPGEVRDLAVKLRFDADSWEEIRGCMNLFMSPFGLELPGAQSGFAQNIDIDLSSEEPWRLRIGDGAGGDKPVTRGKTDGNGEARFKLSGAPQADLIPEVAEPEDVDVTVRAVTNLGGNDFYKDVAALPWDALDAAGTAGISLVPQVLSRMKLIILTGAVPVRDWNLEADFEATVVASISSRSATHYLPAADCGQRPVSTSSTEAAVSLASDTVEISAVLLSNPDGNLGDQAVVFVPRGEEFQGYGYGDGVLQFETTGNYTATKSHFKPAVGELPPVRVGQGNGVCDAQGVGGPYIPPTPDCGERTYSEALQVTIPSARTLHVSHLSSTASELWRHCGDAVVVVAPRLIECLGDVQRHGGKFPSIADIYDSSKTVIEVTGTLSCTDMREGYLEEFQYEWTLVLCRIVDGESAC